MFDYKIFEGSNWGVSAVAKYARGFHFQEIDHCGYGEVLSADEVQKVVKQIIDHVNEEENLINPLDMVEPNKAAKIGESTFLEWRGALSGLNDQGVAETVILSIEIDKHDN